MGLVGVRIRTPYDPYRRRVIDPDAKSFGYKFPALDYDHTLAAYSEWLVSLRQQRRTVVNLHSAMNMHLKQRRAKQVSFSLCPDAVHPSPTGHWLITQTLLQEIKGSATVEDVEIDATKQQAKSGAITNLKRSGEMLSFGWRSRIPMPMDPAWDHQSIELEKVNETWNKYRLRITGLEGTKFRLIAGGQAIAEITAEEFNSGVDLLKFSDFPTVKKSADLLRTVKDRRRLVYESWRSRINRPLGRKRLDPKRIRENMMAVKGFDSIMYKLRQPVSLQIRVEPVTSQ